MVEIIDGVESIVMSLGSEKAAARGNLLGLETVQVYQLRTDVTKSNDAVKKGIASPLSDRPAPAVTAGSSPESRKPSPSSITSAKEAAASERGAREYMARNKTSAKADKPATTPKRSASTSSVTSAKETAAWERAAKEYMARNKASRNKAS